MLPRPVLSTVPYRSLKKLTILVSSFHRPKINELNIDSERVKDNRCSSAIAARASPIGNIRLIDSEQSAVPPLSGTDQLLATCHRAPGRH